MGIMLAEDTRGYVDLVEYDPMVGVKVRSYDFPHGNQADDGCFIEGTIVDKVTEVNGLHLGCERYKIKVERKVFASEERKIRDEFVYPPVNGTRNWLGGVTMAVQPIG